MRNTRLGISGDPNGFKFEIEILIKQLWLIKSFFAMMTSFKMDMTSYPVSIEATNEVAFFRLLGVQSKSRKTNQDR